MSGYQGYVDRQAQTEVAMNECKNIYLKEGSKWAGIWMGVTSAATYLFWRKGVFPKYIRPQHTMFLIAAAGTCAFYAVGENASHDCTTAQKTALAIERGDAEKKYSIFGEDK